MGTFIFPWCLLWIASHHKTKVRVWGAKRLGMNGLHCAGTQFSCLQVFIRDGYLGSALVSRAEGLMFNLPKYEASVTLLLLSVSFFFEGWQLFLEAEGVNSSPQLSIMTTNGAAPAVTVKQPHPKATPPRTPLNDRILATMERRSVAAHPWHDLEIGVYSIPPLLLHASWQSHWPLEAIRSLGFTVSFSLTLIFRASLLILFWDVNPL